MSILAIIGVLFIFWFISRGLKKASNFLNRLGDDLIKRSDEKRILKSIKWDDKKSKENVSILKNKIVSIKTGSSSQEDFESKVRREIEEITGE